MTFSGSIRLLALSAGVSALTAAPAPETSTAIVAAGIAAAPLREMSTDRPDATESPFTVNAGHLQIEGDLVSRTRNQMDGTRTRDWSYGAVNLRFGVAEDFELGVFVSPWTRHTEQPRGLPAETVAGFGDVVVRSKFNFFGNNDGPTALGAILDLKLPTAAEGLGNDAVEGAFFIPLAHELPGGWGLGAMAAVDLRRRETGTGYQAVLITTATVGHDLSKRVGIYFELTSEAGEGTHVATFDLGLTFHVDDNLQLDCGANLGISRAAEDIQLFAGLARRF